MFANSKKNISFLLLIAGAFFVVLCSELEEVTEPVVTSDVNFQDDIYPLMSSNCVECHNNDTPSGNYDLRSIKGIKGKGMDNTSNAIPGNENSLLVTATQPNGSMFQYTGSPENAGKIKAWVVDYNMDIKEPEVHEDGWFDLNSDNFHGKAVKKNGWNFSSCFQCHGTDETGGAAKKSCSTCHPDGFEACNVCHGGYDNNTGAPPSDLSHGNITSTPGVGAHSAHINPDGTSLSAPLNCNTCHVVPSMLKSPGHVDSESPAEVVFNGLAVINSQAEPGYTYLNSKCMNIYCHGNFSGGNNRNMQWNSIGNGEADCGTCHGLPPVNQASSGFSHTPAMTYCTLCHSDVVNDNKEFKDKSLHINGEVNYKAIHDSGWKTPGTAAFHGKVIQESGWNINGCTACHGGDYKGGISGSSCYECHSAGPAACHTCHGSGDEGMPPPDLDGSSDTDAVTVGAHMVHFNGSEFSDGVACGECHKVPAEYGSEGHVDGNLPAEVIFGEVAKKRNAVPVWNRNKASCSSVYCHGNFNAGKKDNTPEWNITFPEQAACGSCHGLPPVGKTAIGFEHQPNSLNCSGCHVSVTGKYNKIINKSLHINGQVDF